MTPTTSYGLPLRLIVRPTIDGSAPNRRLHKPSLSSTTRSLPLCSSSVVNARPSAGVTRSTDKRFGRQARRDEALRLARANQVEVLRRAGERDVFEDAVAAAQVAMVGGIDPRALRGVRKPASRVPRAGRARGTAAAAA